jgi:Zn-dependent M16 (insulinase) family peptidase
MTVVHGFRLLEQRYLPELKTDARLYEHVATGAQLLSLVNDDENKVFGIAFRTPPSDSTGVAHILEHSVLCGSRKYPVKEPFVELLKSSLKTFLNAFTYPDKTVYPVASQNLRDFYNLVDVYLDAVFYPRITPEVLMQEGWHLEMEAEDGPVTYQGVVYGEMKGVYSSPDSLLGRYCQQSLFPDVTYGFDSGGDPAEIPNLTFEQFKAFHERYYHPSNARIFFCGDDDPEERLRYVNAFLEGFGHKEVDSRVGLQRRFDEPRRFEHPYAVSADAGQSAKAMISVNWLLPETRDIELGLTLQILSFILVGMSGSPLRKALIDSGLGEDLTSGGLETELRQMCFSTGLKGVAPSDVDKVERLILDVLRRLVDDGIDRELVEAAVNTIEFGLRERNTGSLPKGLSYMLQALALWLYDADPMAALAFEAPLGRVKSTLDQRDRFLERVLQHHFIDNPHRTTVVMLPDPDLARRRDEQQTGRLAAIARSLSAQERSAVMDQAARLKKKQQTPDSPESLATIPRLSVSDMPRENKRIPDQVMPVGAAAVPLHFHDLPTSGVVYLDVGFNLKVVPQPELPLLPLFSRALLGTGTDKEDHVSLSRRISATTGGVWYDTLSSATNDPSQAAAWLFLRGKAMAARTDDLTSILADVIRSARFGDRQRIRQLLLEDKSRLEQALIPSGHSFVDTRLRAGFGVSEWVSEQLGGVTYLLFLRGLLDDVDRDWPSVEARLRRLAALLFNQRNMVLNLTVDNEALPSVRASIDRLVSGLPSFSPALADWHPTLDKHNEGLTIPAQVNYVGKAANLYDLGYRFHGSALVITRFLRTSWLWDRVRVQGGAYGAFCRLNRLTGVFAQVSYRDPNLDRTLETFDATAQFLRTVPLAQAEIDQNIIGAIGDLDTYMLPDAKGYVSLVRSLTGQTPEILDQIRQEILDTRENHFREFGNLAEGMRDIGRIVVLGGAEAVDKASADGLRLQVLKLL